MSNESDKIFEEILESRLKRGSRGAGAEPTAQAEGQFDPLLDIADLLWEAAHGAPPLEDDPTAAMLGLVPDPHCSLDPRELKRVRANAKVKPSELAGRLRGRGWKFQTRDVVRWESRSSDDVAPALIRAIADELGVDFDVLVTDAAYTEKRTLLAEVTTSPTFAQLVDRWAELRRIPVSMARSALESRLVAAVHRGDQPDEEQLLQSLAALVGALEESNGHEDGS